MSVFSIMKKGRQQAKEQDAQATEKGKADVVKQPYKHVPTHAAIDAMSGSPSSWRHQDRPKIMEQNRRRSAIAGSSLRSSGLPRVGSSLSHVSYPDVYNTPVVPLPKNYSFSSMPATWRSNDSHMDYFSHGGSLKGKEPASAAGLPRRTAYSTPGTPRLGSGDSLHMASRMPSAAAHRIGTRSLSVDTRPGASRSLSTDTGSVHHLHPTQRRASGHSSAPDRHYPPSTRSTHFTKPQPIDPTSIRNDESAPPVPGLPAGSGEFGSASSSLSGEVSSASSIASRGNTAASSVASIAVCPPKESKSATDKTTASQPPTGPTVPAVQSSPSTSRTSSKASPKVESRAVGAGSILSRRLSKTQAESKPPKEKKHRWSLRSHKTPAVATV